MSGTTLASGSHRLGRAVDRRLVGAGAVAVAAPALVTLLALTSTDALVPGLLYVLGIAAAAALGGSLVGLGASVVAFLPFTYFFASQRHGFGFSRGSDLLGGLLFLATAVGVGTSLGRERSARALADAERRHAIAAHEAAEQARAAAEAAARRAQRLQQTAEALANAITAEQVLDGVLTKSGAAADASAGLIASLTPDGTALEILAERGYGDSVLRPWRRFPVAAPYPLSEAVRTGEAVFLRSERERRERFPELETTGEPRYALVCLPLVVEGRTIGGLTFSFGEDQEFDDDRRALKLALARQAAQALERARLYEALQAAESRVSFLAEASEVLASSLDYERTLRQLAGIAVPRLADWCAIDVLDESGELERVARAGPSTDLPADGPQTLRVPLRALDRELGTLTLGLADASRVFGQADLDLAAALAGRIGVAIENARLYDEAERRGEAARALTYVGDAVVLVDRSSAVRYWNQAAEVLAGVPAEQALGRPVTEVVPDWATMMEHVHPVDAGTGELAPSATVPMTIGASERWLSAAAVDFGDGCVFALRDVTEEHALEQARSDFVATASHELRTPLAAVYGAVRTLRRTDVDIGDENAERFLEMIEHETERLNAIVGQILVTGQLEGDALDVHETTCDLEELSRGVLAAARVRAPDSIRLDLRAADGLAPIRCDEGKLRQVLVNLVENAIKYSPDGGDVTVELGAANGWTRIDVRDQGLGIPAADQTRIFEKFARLDPGLSRGVGGSGLGLYIARELTERMGGRLTLVSAPGRGSTFTVSLPTAGRPPAV